MTTPQIAQGLAGLGRNGDSMLMHVTPQEVAGLQAIAQANGTSLTTNPDTGMPEAFNLGGFFKSLLPTIAGFAAAGMSGGAMSPMLAGILAGSATGAISNKKDPLMGAVMGGIGGYGGSSLYGSAVNPALAGQATTKELVKNAGVDPSMLVPGTATTPSAGMGFNFSNIPAGQGVQLTQAGNPTQYLGSDALLGGSTDAISNVLRYSTPSNFAVTPSAVGGAGIKAGTADLTAGIGQGGLQNAVSNIAQDPMAFLSQNKMAVGMPLGMAALSGLEPPTSGMTQAEFEAERRRKYNQPLNLNQDSGLRLAAGGAIQTGGVMDLYQGTDSQATFGGDQGFGLGRLNNLATQQSVARAEQGNYAAGGVPKLEDGGFVVPADVTFYMGDHNTEKGQQRLAQMYGGQPITGPGSGLSDSIPTSIEGKEPARIANGEVYIPRKTVEAHGGSAKFYKMMDKVRKKATGSTKQAKSA